MAFNWELKVPYRYQTTYKTLRQIEAILLEHYHPEYVRRVLAWLHHHNGYVGIGGHFRADGTQPDKPGFAPEGRSFHQNQKYADGFIGASAIDTIVIDGPDANDLHDPIKWSDVPIQDSAEADVWGLHANIDANGNPGAPGTESWHIQWADAHIGGYDLDGWASWKAAGSPGIIPGYPLPPEHDPYPPTDPEDPSMARRYFTTPTSPTATWRTDNNADAIRVDLDHWTELPEPKPTVERLSKAEASQFDFFIGIDRDPLGLSS